MTDKKLWIFWVFAAVGAYYLLTEHREHLLDYLPYLLLMACPLMHLLHRHGGHHDKSSHHDTSSHTDERKAP